MSTRDTGPQDPEDTSDFPRHEDSSSQPTFGDQRATYGEPDYGTDHGSSEHGSTPGYGSSPFEAAGSAYGSEQTGTQYETQQPTYGSAGGAERAGQEYGQSQAGYGLPSYGSESQFSQYGDSGTGAASPLNPGQPQYGQPQYGQPQPGGWQQYGQPNYFQGSPHTGERYDVGQALRFSLDRLMANPIPWLVSQGALFLIMLAVGSIFGFGGIFQGQDFDSTDISSTELSSFLATLFVMVIALSAIWVVANNAFIRAALMESDGIRPDYKDFITYRNLAQFFFAALLIFVATVVGVFAVLIGSLIVWFFTLFALSFAMDRNMDAVSAVRASTITVKDNLSDTFLYALAMIGIAVATSVLQTLFLAIPVIGPILNFAMFVMVTPFTLIFTARTYRIISANGRGLPQPRQYV